MQTHSLTRALHSISAGLGFHFSLKAKVTDLGYCLCFFFFLPLIVNQRLKPYCVTAIDKVVECWQELLASKKYSVFHI